MTGLTFREMFGISTHAPLAGRDLRSKDILEIDTIFQPTRPLRGATGGLVVEFRLKAISTHAPLAGRDAPVPREQEQLPVISTHAPLAGRDF